MLRDYIANYYEFEKYRVSLNAIIPFLPQRLTKSMKEVAQLEKWQTIPDFLLGQSQAMRDLKETIRRTAPGDHTVLITGSSGTGKELIARAIHYLSPRWQEPFISLNCATLREERFDSDLYGHEKGAFTGAHSVRKGTFETAGKGTVFLDEIGELPLTVQAGMLRTLQEKTIIRVGGEKMIPLKCRIIVATNKDLGKATQEGSFRPDMYYRLINGAYIHSPALAEREDDIIMLTLWLVIKHIKETCMNIADNRAPLLNQPDRAKRVTVHQSFFKAMKSHSFAEGNIRDLEGIVKRAMLNLNNKILTEEDFLHNVIHPAAKGYHRPPPLDRQFVDKIRQLIETKSGIHAASKDHIATILVCFGSNRFSPKSFIEQMKKTHPLHDNTCRKYLSYLNKWGIIEHNHKMASGSLYRLAENLLNSSSFVGQADEDSL